MPAYDYYCDNCGYIELRKSMEAPHPTKCPQCGDKGLRRIFNAPAIQILGEHFRTSRPKAPIADGMTIQPRSS